MLKLLIKEEETPIYWMALGKMEEEESESLTFSPLKTEKPVRGAREDTKKD